MGRRRVGQTGNQVERSAFVTRLLGVVLSGGKSSRMGRDKSSLLHRSGVSFLQYACDRLEPICQQRVIVGGRLTVEGVRTLTDALADQGPAMGIATAIDHASQFGFDACLVSAVDLPNLTTDHLRPLIRAWMDRPFAPACLVDSDDLRLQPLAGLYPVSLHEELASLATSQQRSLTRWLSCKKLMTIPAPPEVLHNVNHPEDLESES